MISRTKKIVLASLVLITGIAVAWPFRKTGEQAATIQPAPGDDWSSQMAASHPAADPVSDGPRPVGTSAWHITARKAAISSPSSRSQPPQPITEFDLSNHPALQNPPLPETLDLKPTSPLLPVTQPTEQHARPSYAVASQGPFASGDDPAARQSELIYTVRNGDTLEKLAQRYLDDAGRALEIFDLNRDQLTNPYLLPIGAQLQIPVDPTKQLD